MVALISGFPQGCAFCSWFTLLVRKVRSRTSLIVGPSSHNNPFWVRMPMSISGHCLVFFPSIHSGNGGKIRGCVFGSHCAHCVVYLAQDSLHHLTTKSFHSDHWTTVPIFLARNVLFWIHYPKTGWKVYLYPFLRVYLHYKMTTGLEIEIMTVSPLVSSTKRHGFFKCKFFRKFLSRLYISIDSMINKPMSNPLCLY